MKNTLFVIRSRNNTSSRFCILEDGALKIVSTRPENAPFRAISAAPIREATINAIVAAREPGESVAFAKKGAEELWGIYLKEGHVSLQELIYTFSEGAE